MARIPDLNTPRDLHWPDSDGSKRPDADASKNFDLAVYVANDAKRASAASPTQGFVAAADETPRAQTVGYFAFTEPDTKSAWWRAQRLDIAASQAERAGMDASDVRDEANQAYLQTARIIAAHAHTQPTNERAWEYYQKAISLLDRIRKPSDEHAQQSRDDRLSYLGWSRDRARNLMEKFSWQQDPPDPYTAYGLWHQRHDDAQAAIDRLTGQ